MKFQFLTLLIVILLSAHSSSSADRPLDSAEILQIFDLLVNQGLKTWIPAGTIEANHEEYRAPKTTNSTEINSRINQEVHEYQSNPNKRELTENLQKMKLDAIPFNVRYRLSNEYTMNSDVIVKFDGDRFYWEINVTSRTDSVKAGKNLEGNFMTEQFDLNLNTRRIFVWDGQKYTIYSLPGNLAIVDSKGGTPHVVNGPLTAGLIPWGYGYYTYENLSNADFSAVEKYVDGRSQIDLTLSNADGSEMLFVLDPAKDYAIISCLMSGRSTSVISNHYDDYRLISGNWIPTTILLERYEVGTGRLLARDLWDIIRIDDNVPASFEFDVDYKDEVLIEHFSSVSDKSQMYYYSPAIDTDLLLAERLTYVSNEGTQPQNCASAALKYAASRLGKDVTDQQLAGLIKEPNGQTSLYDMKEFAKGLGLYCRAVKTDIQELQNLYDCEVILYFPGKKHFVVLDYIDSRYVWTIDLSDRKFYNRTDIDFFDMDWTENVALLISNRPIAMQSKIIGIDDQQLHNIEGGSGYSCTRLLQSYYYIVCDYVGGLCGGYYEMYFTRYGCEAAESGSCTSKIMLRFMESPCIEDPYNPLACTVTEWTLYGIIACS
jgi:hypothetical protein